jgi:N-acetylmuramoyl-L-alanine amidase
MTPESIGWLIICIYFEARGQTFAEKVKVGHVVYNRSIKRDLPIKQIVKQPYQFSFMNENDPQELAIKDFDAYIECVRAAYAVDEEQQRGLNFYRADHYHDHSISPPNWTHNMTVVETTDDFTFYRG